MKIAVCVKQVPDTTARKELTDDFRLNRASLDSVLNPFDEYALEEGIRQKEAHEGEVAMVTMGPASAEETMRKGLAMGADRGVLITDSALAGSDIWVTATALAAALRSGGYDLILCGQESADARTGLLPGALAEHLGLPFLSYVQKLDIEGSQLRVRRQLSGGYEVISANLPAVVMVVKAINEPRYPSLKGIMASKRKQVTKLDAGGLGLEPASLGIAGSRTEVVAATPRPAKEPGRMLTEPPSEAAKLIADFLAENKVIA